MEMVMLMVCCAGLCNICFWYGNKRIYSNHNIMDHIKKFMFLEPKR